MLKGFEFPIVAVSMDILWAHLGCQRVEWLRPESGVLCCWSGAVPGHLQSGNDIGGQRFGSPRACSLIAFAMIQSTFALWPSDMWPPMRRYQDKRRSYRCVAEGGLAAGG